MIPVNAHMSTLPRRDSISIRVIVIVGRLCDPVHGLCLFCALTSTALQNDLQRALRATLEVAEGGVSDDGIRDDDDNGVYAKCDDDEDEEEVGGNNDASLSHLCFCLKEEGEASDVIHTKKD